MAVNANSQISNNNFQGWCPGASYDAEARTGPVTGGVASHNVTIGRVDGNVQFGDKIDDKVTLGNWVSEIDFSRDQSQAFERYTDGTLLWVLETPEFVNWLQYGGMLWSSGKPGAGKTIFASFVIEYLQKKFAQDTKAAVCYIYFRYDATRSTLQLFEAILKQLVLRCPSANLERVREAKKRGQRLTLSDILTILQEIFDQAPNIVIVIDAFDECFDEPTRHHVLQKLRLLQRVKTMITSRPLASIRSAMSGIPTLIISARSNGIKTYLQAQTELNPKLQRLLQDDSRGYVETKIIEKASGMFLLAHLHVTDLAKQTNKTQLLHALETLPKEATATYQATLERIRQRDEHEKQLAFYTLSWIFHALRPLSLIELRHALAIHNLDRMAEENDLAEGEFILSACAGLVVASGNSGGGNVSFLHYTLQEFLQQEARIGSDFLSGLTIASTCMRVLSFPGIKLNPPNYPLIQYSAAAWIALARQYEHHDEVFQLVLSQLTNTSTIEIIRQGSKYAVRATALHVAAINGLLRTGKAILADPSIDVNAADEEHGRTAALWATVNRHFELVEEILSHPNSTANVPKEYSAVLLPLAAEKQSLKIVKQLLGFPNLDINVPDERHGRTALAWAIEHDRLDIVMQLLAHPNISVNLRDEFGRTVISLAAEKGRFAVLQELLIRPNIDVNSKDILSLRTPLFWAVQNGHLEVTRALLHAKGVDVDVPDKHGLTPLSIAAGKGHLEIMKVLLAHPHTNLNFPSKGICHTPLSWAARNGHLQVVKELLAHPNIDVNHLDAYHQTPLCLAVTKGHLEVVKELLSHPAVSVNVRDKRYGLTPLCYATEMGQLATATSLLDSGRIVLLRNRKAPDTTALYGESAADSLQVSMLPSQLSHSQSPLSDRPNNVPQEESLPQFPFSRNGGRICYLLIPVTVLQLQSLRFMLGFWS